MPAGEVKHTLAHRPYSTFAQTIPSPATPGRAHLANLLVDAQASTSRAPSTPRRHQHALTVAVHPAPDADRGEAEITMASENAPVVSPRDQPRSVSMGVRKTLKAQ